MNKWFLLVQVFPCYFSLLFWFFIDDYVISFFCLITVYLALTKWLLTNHRFETSPS